MTDDPRLPDIAHEAEIHGGELDGAHVALVDTRDTALSLIITPDGMVHLQTYLGPRELHKALVSIAETARLKAEKWEAEQS